MRFKCPKCGKVAGFKEYRDRYLICNSCGATFLKSYKEPAQPKVAKTAGKEAEEPAKRDWLSIGNYLAKGGITVAKILHFVIFFAGVEYAFFTLIRFAIKFLGSGISGFWINASIFFAGMLFALWLVDRTYLMKTIVLISLIVAAALVPSTVYVFFPKGVEYPSGAGNYFSNTWCMITNLGDPTECMIIDEEKPPEPKMIYDFQPIEIRFGSKYTPTPFSLSTLRANDADGYSLTLTVTNPNLDKELAVENFYIKTTYYREDGVNRDADMIGKGYKIMCGKASKCTEEEPCTLSPNSDSEITIKFNQFEEIKEFDPVTDVEFTIIKEECETADDFQIRIREDDCKTEEIKSCIDAKGNVAGCSEQEKQKSGCLRELCENKCKEKYPCVEFAYFTYTYNAMQKSGNCLCIRDRNNFADLCCEDVFGDEVKISFYAVHDFSVTGRGEFRVAQAEEYLNFVPKVETSAGPLSVAVYFSPRLILSEDMNKEIMMFVNLKNNGEGYVDFNLNLEEMSMNQDKTQAGFVDGDIANCIEKIKERMEMVRAINAGESEEIMCKLKVESKEEVKTFSTIMVNVQMNYTYVWQNLKTLPISKTMFNPITDKEFIGRPGYCPWEY